MDDDTNSPSRLTRRRVLSALGVVGVAGAGTGAGTFALFRDTETSKGNTVQAGTLDLELSGSADPPGQSSGSFTVSNFRPTQTVTRKVRIENPGSIDPDHVEFDVGTTESEAGTANEADAAPTSAGGFARMVEVSLTYGGGTDLTPPDTNGNGIVDLADLRAAGVLDDVTPAPASNGGSETLELDLTFVSDSAARYTGGFDDDDFQGDQLDIRIDAGLAQQAGQSVLPTNSTIVSSGLVVRYPFDGNTHEVISGFDGQPTDALSYTAGKLDRAADFDGSTSVVIPGLPDDRLDSGLTIAAWIRTRDRARIGQRIFGDDDNNSGGYALSLGDPGDGRLRFYNRAKDTISLDTGAVVSNNTWYHVAAVYDDDANERYIYVDGIEEAALMDDTGPWGTDDGTAGAGGEGPDSTETGRRFDGAIDDLRVYDRPLSPAEVTKLASGE